MWARCGSSFKNYNIFPIISLKSSFSFNPWLKPTSFNSIALNFFVSLSESSKVTFISGFLSFLLSRDAIAKALYSVLFDWLVEQINKWLSPTEMDSTVGIVDIYGFEVTVQFGLWSGNVQVIKHILV